MGYVPGSASIREYVERNIYAGLDGATPGFLPGGGVIDANYAVDGKNGAYIYELRSGTPLAQITASGKWVPCKRTRVNGAVSDSDTIVVDDSRAFKAGDTITVGNTTGIEILEVDYETDEIVTDVSDLDASDNAIVIASGALAGAETARCILDEYIDLYDQDARAPIDRTFGRGVVSAKLLSEAILGDLASIRAATNYLNFIQFFADGIQS